ncbi:MAG: anhydro-N-acetylmuramic acid kinase [Phycisphaerae bacterium]|nr:anhydro-N-acetylmuramic acid kinase [Phycisphaerae bacterium]
MDAVDAALVVVEGHGLAIRVSVRRCATGPLGPLARALREFAEGRPTTAAQMAGLAREFALRHVDVVRDAAEGKEIDLIAIHGQTVFHAPPVSWQLFAPAPIVEALRAPVVFDLRAADLAAGGQGAPITPLADWVLFRHEVETRVVVNLGGFANYTLLPAGSGRDDGTPEEAVNGIRGGDICVCNLLLDAIARRWFSTPFDEDGRRAGSGQIQTDLRDALVSLLTEQASAGRSLGTGDELIAWLNEHAGVHRPEDLARSACDAVGFVIAMAVRHAARTHSSVPLRRILLAGGGVHNRVLASALQQHAEVDVQTTEAFGVPVSHREAAEMAVLGALCQDGVPITLPQITGVRAPTPVAGVWAFPGSR